jgi:hypothetical protein
MVIPLSTTLVQKTKKFRSGDTSDRQGSQRSFRRTERNEDDPKISQDSRMFPKIIIHDRALEAFLAARCWGFSFKNLIGV